MAGRSLKGHVAHISTSFLRLLNMVVLAGAIGSIVLLFIIKHNPTFPGGWGFVLLGIITGISGLFGAISSGQGGCFGCHLFCMLLSTAGLCASFLIIFLKLNTVLDAIDYDIRRSSAKSFLRAEGALYFIVFCVQLVIFLMACLIQQCGFIDYYEDLEAQQVEVTAKQQVAAEKRKEKTEARSSHILAEKMKQKYGAYNEDPAYDRERERNDEA